MKKLITIALLATTTSVAFAADRAIYDIMYLPNAGTSYGFTDLNLESREIEADSGDDEIDGMRLSQTIGHSFTDRFTLNANFNLYDGERDPENGSSTDEDGLSDLGVNARFRMMDETIQLDVIGGVQLAIEDSEIESNGDVDNRFTSGGNQMNVGLQVGEKAGDLQWAVLGRFIHAFERSLDTSGGDIDLEPRDAVQVRADLLNKLAEKSLLRSHFTVDLIEETELENGNNFQGSQTNYELGTEYQHIVSQDLLAKVGIDYRMSNYESADVDSDTAWILHVGANYQF